MSSVYFEEDILQIDSDFQDLLSDDESSGDFVKIISDHENSENNVPVNSDLVPELDNPEPIESIEIIWLKFFRKGKLSCADLKHKLLDFLVNKKNFKLNGLFFRDDLDVLVEVLLDNSLREFLINIYEERLGSKVLKKKSIQNIVKLCDGKFSLVIDEKIILFNIAHNYDLYYFPCKSMVSKYGLSNGDILNIFTEKFVVDIRFSVYEAFLLIQEELPVNMNYFVGMRLERSEDNINEGWIRFSIIHKKLNISVLEKLKKIFSVINFSSVTMHLISTTKAGITLSAHNNLNINDDMTFLTTVDLIYPRGIEKDVSVP